MADLKIMVETPLLNDAIDRLSDTIMDLFNFISTNKVDAKKTAETVDTAVKTANEETYVDPDSYIEPTAPVEPKKPETVEEKSYTLQDISAAGCQLLDAGKMDALMKLLEQFNVKAITMLDKKDYPKFVIKLRDLGAKI